MGSQGTILPNRITRRCEKQVSPKIIQWGKNRRSAVARRIPAVSRVEAKHLVKNGLEGFRCPITPGAFRSNGQLRKLEYG